MILRQSIKKHKHTILLIFILVLGFGLRMSQPTLVEFKRDEATITRLGQAIAYEGYLPAVGVDSSLGIDCLPLTLYIAAAAVRVWNDPVAVVILTCLLNSLALVTCYYLTRDSLGKHPALIATLLFAVSPWAVLYARKIWARTLPLATLGFIAALYLTFVKRKTWMLVGAFAGLAVLLGLQLEALAYIPVLGVLMLVYWKDINWRAFAVGVLVFVLLIGPYIINDLTHGFENTRGLLNYAGGDGQWSTDALRFSLTLLGSAEIDGQAGPFHETFVGQMGPFWWFNHMLSAIFIAGILYAIAQAIRQRKTDAGRTYLILLVWLAFPVLLQLRPSTSTQRHYYVMHYPAQFMLMGTVLVAGAKWVKKQLLPVDETSCEAQVAKQKPLTQPTATLSRKRRRDRTRTRLWHVLYIAGCVMLIAISIWQVGVTRLLRDYMRNEPGIGGYGTPLYFTRNIAQKAIDMADGGEIVVLDEGTQPHITEIPTVYDALLFGEPHRFVAWPGALLLPSDEVITYIMSDALTEAYPQTLFAEAGIFQLPAGMAQDIYDYTTPLLRGIPFDNGVVFNSFVAPTSGKSGETIEVWLLWWVQSVRSEPAQTHFTVQLLDADGNLLSQDDHMAFPASTWQVDDQVLSRFYVEIPQDASGTLTIRAGMYTYPEIESVAVIDHTGQVVDDGVTLVESVILE